MAKLPTPNPAVRWILTVGIVVVLLVAGYLYYNRLQDEQESYLASIAQSQHTIETFEGVDLNALEAEIADLKSRASTADTRYTSLLSKYRSYTHTIEIEEELYEAAEESQVIITSLVCNGPQTEEVGTEVFNSYVFSIAAESPVPPQLLNFMRKVADEFDTVVIESVEMSVPRPAAGGDDGGGSDEEEETVLEEEDESQPKSTISLILKVLYLPRETQ